MKKIFKLMSIFTLLMSFMTTNCNHIHNEECGYNLETQSKCTHIHDESCNPIDPLFDLGPDGPKK